MACAATEDRESPNRHAGSPVGDRRDEPVWESRVGAFGPPGRGAASPRLRRLCSPQLTACPGHLTTRRRSADRAVPYPTASTRRTAWAEWGGSISMAACASPMVSLGNGSTGVVRDVAWRQHGVAPWAAWVGNARVRRVLRLRWRVDVPPHEPSNPPFAGGRRWRAETKAFARA